MDMDMDNVGELIPANLKGPGTKSKSMFPVVSSPSGGRRTVAFLGARSQLNIQIDEDRS